MASRNDITGDSIRTKSATQAYRDNWDKIFAKKDKPIDLSTMGVEATGTGILADSHELSEEEFTKMVDSIPVVEAPAFMRDRSKEAKYCSFSITVAQQIMISKWQKEEVFPEVVARQKLDPNYPSWSCYMGENGEEYPYSGAIGGGLTYSFTPTSLGDIIKVTSYGKELDITEYDSF